LLSRRKSSWPFAAPAEDWVVGDLGDPVISRRAALRSISLALGLLAGPPAARAQEAGRTYRLGALTPSPRHAPQYVALFDELRRVGFVAGENLSVDTRGFGPRTERFPELARELVNAKVDVFLCVGDSAIRAAQQATATIPILAITDDMVGSGLVRSLANHGGNTTGVSILATQLDSKRQERLIEIVPALRRMAALADSNTTAPLQLQALQEVARARGVELSLHRIAKPEEIAPAVDAAKKSGAAALNVLASPLLFANRRSIFERAAALRLPAMYQWPEMAEDGGLVGYGPRLVEIYREMMTRQAVKLLRGAKPADLPVEQPTKFELVINLKTAKALGLTIPRSVLLQADRLID
jgi:putative tryptophan/tyrosine transport system substrate-binding protein